MNQIIPTISLILASFLFYIRQLKVEETIASNGNYSAPELLNQGPLLNQQGQLIEYGWSRKPLKQLNEESISFYNRMLRLKKWDYYHLTTESQYLSIAFVDLGYTQSIQFTYFDGQTVLHKDALILWKNLNLTKSAMLSNEELQFYFSDNFTVYCRGRTNKGVDRRSINIEFEGFEATFVLEEHKFDDVVAMKPLNEDGSHFFYSRKAYNWNAFGIIQNIPFKNGNGGIDWGRGIFNYNTFWIWISGMGYSNNKQIGFNFGAGNERSQIGSVDEVIFIDHQINKLSSLTYIYDLQNLNKTIIVKNEIFYLEFTPKTTHLHEQDLILVDVKFRQLLGTFKGKYQNIEFDNIVGIVELNRAKW